MSTSCLRWGPVRSLRDLIGSGVIPVVRLTEIFRQASQSWIVRAAHAVQMGELPVSALAAQGNFFFVTAETPEAVIDAILKLIRERIPARFGFDPARDVQVLTPMNRSVLGARNLNVALQAVLNPAVRRLLRVEPLWLGSFCKGDKVLQTVNNYKKEVFNGDIGTTTKIDPVEQELTVDFDNSTARLRLRRAGRTEHWPTRCRSTRARGASTSSAVILPVHTQHYIMLRVLVCFYTGITAGKARRPGGNQESFDALAVSRQGYEPTLLQPLLRRLQNERRG